MAHVWNHNIRFSMNDEDAGETWEFLHSEEVKRQFKSQNAFVIAAINDYYERHLQKKDNPYLETREKEDAFCDRIVEKVEEKVLSKLPALLGAYLLQQQTQMTVSGQMIVPVGNIGAMSSVQAPGVPSSDEVAESA